MQAHSFYDSLWDIARKNEDDYRIALGFAKGFQDHYVTLAQEFTACIYTKLEAALQQKAKESPFWQAWEMSMSLDEATGTALANWAGIGLRLKGKELQVGIEYTTGAQRISFGISTTEEDRQDYFSASLMEALNNAFGVGKTTTHYFWSREFQGDYRNWNNDVALMEIWKDLHGTAKADTSFSGKYVKSLMGCLEILKSNTGPKWPAGAGAK